MLLDWLVIQDIQKKVIVPSGSAMSATNMSQESRAIHMIEIVVTDTARGEVARLEITEDPDSQPHPELCGYMVKVIVDRGDTVGMHQRYINNWPKNAFNTVGLLKAAINELTNEDLAREESDDDNSREAQSDGADQRQALVPRSLAGKFDSVMRALQARER